MVAAVLLAAGCMSTTGVVQYGDLPPEPTPGEQLQEILDWATADGSVDALEAKKQAQAVLRRPSDSEAYGEKISRAWTHAQAASQSGLEAQEKRRLWTLCSNELTHGPSGG
jgi:hypothetical protein